MKSKKDELENKQTSVEELLRKGGESILIASPEQSDPPGVMEKILFKLDRIMFEVQKIKTYTGLKPELIKLKYMKKYFPEFSSPESIRNSMSKGKKFEYILKIGGSLYVVTEKYEAYRKATLKI